MKREELAAFLYERCRGKYKAMSAERIAAETGTGRKVLREQVNKLRQEGIPIASGGDGYYYAKTASDVYATIRNLKKLQAGIEKAVVGLEGALADFGERQDPVGGRDG